MSRLAAALILFFSVGCANADYTFSLQLIGNNAQDTPGSRYATIPAGDIAVVQVSGVPIKNSQNDQSVCVVITAAVGTLTCPGSSCVMAYDGQDGSVANLQRGSHRIFVDIPVGAGTHATFPIYRAPVASGDDELTGEAHTSDCSDINDPATRLTGAAHREILVGRPLDMAAPDQAAH